MPFIALTQSGAAQYPAANASPDPRPVKILRGPWFLIFLASLAALPPLSIDMALPALRGIASGLRAAPGAVGLTLSIFMAGFAATPILYGPVSDRYGRRPVLLAGVAMFALGGLAAAAAPSIDALLLARFIEGGGAGCGIAMAFAIVRDVFAGEEARIKLSYVQMVMALAPMVAPTIGAALLLAGGWRVIYAVLGCGGVALLLVILLGFRETHEPRAGGSLFGAVVAGYRTLLQSRAGLGFALVYACSFGVQFSYIAGSPLVFMGYFGLSPALYGLIFAATAAGIMAGAYSNTLLSRRGHAGHVPLSAGLGLYGVTAAAMLALLASGGADATRLAIALVVSAYGYGLIGPNASHGTLTALPKIAGIAGAVLTTLQMSVAVAASAIVAACYARFGLAAMIVPMVGFGAVTAGLYVFMVRPALRLG
jgi:DHA1 family bicyclomycin/chloramphenicol resistance-like MFS transporter